MRVSNVKVTLTEQDILSIIQDYVQVEGLNVESVYIKESITIKGNYKKKLTIPFEVKVGLGNINNNIINLKLFSVSISKIGILRGIKNIALKKLLSDFSQYGIEVDKDTITIDLSLAVKLIPYFNLRLKTINIIERALETEVEEITYEENKKVPNIFKNCNASPAFKVNDQYSKLREKVKDNIPDKYEKIIEYAILIPDITALLWRLFRDKRVKIKVKMMVAGVAAYLASPIDIIPDFIPLIGRIDDIAMAFFALDMIINEVPEEIILQNWDGEEDIILVTKEAVNYISKIVGSRNVAKLFATVKTILKKAEKNCRKQDIKAKNKACYEVACSVEEDKYIN